MSSTPTSSSIPNRCQEPTPKETKVQRLLRQIYGPPLPPPKIILGTEAEQRTVAGWVKLFANKRRQPPPPTARPLSTSSQLPPPKAESTAAVAGSLGNESSNHQSADAFMNPQNCRNPPGPSSKLAGSESEPFNANTGSRMAILQANRRILKTLQSFKNKTEGELQERNFIIKQLTDTVQDCQAKILELEHEKKDYVSRQSPLFKEIQEDIQNLLGKVNSFVGTDTVIPDQQFNAPNGLLRTPRPYDGRTEESQLTLNALFVKLKSLEESIVSIESNKLKSIEDRMIRIETGNEAMLATFKSSEENLKNYMMENSNKLDQIARMFVPERRRCMSSSSVGTLIMDPDPCPVSNPFLTSHFNEANCLGEKEIANMFDTEICNEEVIEIETISDQEKHDEEPNNSICDNVTFPDIPVETIFSSDSEQSPPPVLPQCSTPPQTNVFEDSLNETIEATMEADRRDGVETTNQNDKIATLEHSVRQGNLFEDYSDISDDDLPPAISPFRDIPPVDEEEERWHTMPILLPEVAPLEPKPRQYFENHLDEGRKKEKKKIKSRKFGTKLEGAKTTPSRIHKSEGHTKKVQEGQMANEGARRKVVGIRREKQSANLELHHSRDFSKSGFSCLCGSKFTGAGGLYVHLVKNMEYEKFSCNLCGKRFHYFSGLKAHRKSTHKMQFTAEVGCSRCGRVFHSKKNRQGHRDSRGQTCWLSGSYQCKNWQIIRNKRVRNSSADSSLPVLSV